MFRLRFNGAHLIYGQLQKQQQEKYQKKYTKRGLNTD